MEGGGVIVLAVIWGFVFWLIHNYWSEIGAAVFTPDVIEGNEEKEGEGYERKIADEFVQR